MQTRCAVLARCGYEAQAAVLFEAEELLGSQEFDLVILSAFLSEWESGKILAAAGKTPVLVLTELTFADKLVALVECLVVADDRRAAVESSDR